MVEKISGTTYFSRYWDSDVELDCEENALALLYVDDSKLMNWNEWTKMIDKNYEVRKYQYSLYDPYPAPEDRPYLTTTVRTPRAGTVSPTSPSLNSFLLNTQGTT